MPQPAHSAQSDARQADARPGAGDSPDTCVGGLEVDASSDGDGMSVTTSPAGESARDPQAEVVQLRRAMQTRPTIDQARGILMAAFSLGPDDAWTTLVMASQNTNTKLHHVAQQLVDSVQGEALPEAVQAQLSAAVARLNAPPADQDTSRDADPEPTA